MDVYTNEFLSGISHLVSAVEKCRAYCIWLFKQMYEWSRHFPLAPKCYMSSLWPEFLGSRIGWLNSCEIFTLRHYLAASKRFIDGKEGAVFTAQK